MAHNFRTADKTSPAARARAADYNSRQHKQLKIRYQREIDSGHGHCYETICVHRTRHIPRGAAWHLAHTADRTGYLGSSHPECNIKAAAKAGNAKQRAKRRPVRRAQSRVW